MEVTNLFEITNQIILLTTQTTPKSPHQEPSDMPVSVVFLSADPEALLESEVEPLGSCSGETTFGRLRHSSTQHIQDSIVIQLACYSHYAISYFPTQQIMNSQLVSRWRFAWIYSQTPKSMAIPRIYHKKHHKMVNHRQNRSIDGKQKSSSGKIHHESMKIYGNGGFLK